MGNPKSVYVFGPIHMFGESYLPIYRKVSVLLKNKYRKVISTYPDFWNTGEAPKQFYLRTYREIVKCDLFIAEISQPSTGVGMELQIAYERGIPVIGLCRAGSTPSTMALGIPALKRLITYKNTSDLLNQLKAVIDNPRKK